MSKCNEGYTIGKLRSALLTIPLWLTLLFFAAGCELVGFVGQTQAQTIALKQCSSFRLTSLEAPEVHSTEWLTVGQAEARGLSLGQHAPDTMVWVITLEGRWQLEGGPPPPEGATPFPNPIFQRCIAVLDARTGELFATHAEP